MKKVRQIKFNGAELKMIGRRLKAWSQHLPLLVFVRFGSILNLATVLVVAAAAGILIWRLLYQEPVVSVMAPAAQPQLSTEAIDRLEYWIEAREDERKKAPPLPAREFFKGALK